MQSRSAITTILAGQMPTPRLGCKRAPSARYWYQRGVDAEHEGDIAHARYCYHRAVAQRPAFADAHNQLGRLAHELAQLPSTTAADRQAQLAIAESHYRLALCATPHDGIYWFNRGRVLEQQGQWSLAIAAYESALTCDPTFVEAHVQLAALFEQRSYAGDPDAARLAIRHLSAARRGN